MRSAIVVSVVAIAIPVGSACASQSRSEPTRVSRSEPRVVREAPAPRADVARYDADNTGRNVRDRESANRTPLDQSEKRSDIETTRQIRKSLVHDKSLSTNAKNVKIITVDGDVTLRGPVSSEKERAKIVANAKRIAGTGNVDDQLEIETRR